MIFVVLHVHSKTVRAFRVYIVLEAQTELGVLARQREDMREETRSKRADVVLKLVIGHHQIVAFIFRERDINFIF